MKSVHLIWAHPRTDSLTAHVVDAVREELQKANVKLSEIDLYRYKFEPRLNIEDEPDWDNPDKRYSDEVMKLSNELNQKDILIFIFPTWWASIPAILKGYIDRVFNYGIAYGGHHDFKPKVWRWIGLVGETQEDFDLQRKAAIDMKNNLNNSIAKFCGAKDSQVTLLYNSLGIGVANKEEFYKNFIQEAVDSVRKIL